MQGLRALRMCFLENDRRPDIIGSKTERKGAYDIVALGFVLKAKSDRVDILSNGCLQIIDYKTGAPPTQNEQAFFEKQLLLTALMAENGSFVDFGPKTVQSISYIGLGTTPKTETTEITPHLLAEVKAGLMALISRYNDPNQGYTARRAMFSTAHSSDYDQSVAFWRMGLKRKDKYIMRILDDASLRQIEAANPRASTWLSANAGSGKTKVLIDRVALSLLEGVEPGAHFMPNLHKGRRLGNAGSFV